MQSWNKCDCLLLMKCTGLQQMWWEKYQNNNKKKRDNLAGKPLKICNNTTKEISQDLHSAKRLESGTDAKRHRLGGGGISANDFSPDIMLQWRPNVLARVCRTLNLNQDRFHWIWLDFRLQQPGLTCPVCVPANPPRDPQTPSPLPWDPRATTVDRDAELLFYVNCRKVSALAGRRAPRHTWSGKEGFLLGRPGA